MKRRRPGLQGKWSRVINSLEGIVPSYERTSSRISIFADKRMRSEAVDFAVSEGSSVLDLGSGPGPMSRLVFKKGGVPVLLDASRAMLGASPGRMRVQGTFEHLPFRRGVFDSVVSGFAVRDAQDLGAALAEVGRVLKQGGRFGFCDLGKPDSDLLALGIAAYLRIVPTAIGLLTAGRSGLGYGSIFDTYILVLRNSQLAAALSALFDQVKVHETQFGGSIVATCVNG